MPSTPNLVTDPVKDADDADRYRFLTMFNADEKKSEQLMPHIEPWYEQWEHRDAHEAGDLDATHAFTDKLRDTAIGLKLWWPI